MRHVSFILKSNSVTVQQCSKSTLNPLIFDEVTDENKLAPFYGPRVVLSSTFQNISFRDIFTKYQNSKFRVKETFLNMPSKVFCTLSRSTGWTKNEVITWGHYVWMLIASKCVKQFASFLAYFNAIFSVNYYNLITVYSTKWRHLTKVNNSDFAFSRLLREFQCQILSRTSLARLLYQTTVRQKPSAVCLNSSKLCACWRLDMQRGVAKVWQASGISERWRRLECTLCLKKVPAF